MILNKVKTLTRVLIICAFCKKFRNEDGEWSDAENLDHRHAKLKISHGVCTSCLEKYYPEYM